MRRLLRLTALAMVALAATRCATLSVSSHMQRGLNFAQFHTYDWGPADAFPTGDPRLDQNPFFRDHVEGAVEKQLAAKGFERSTSGTPDLLIHYHASIDQRIDVDRVDHKYGYCYDETCRAGVIDYEAGTLVLDIVEARTNRVIWRGWAQGTVEDILHNQDKMARRIRDAVSQMLERLPGRL